MMNKYVTSNIRMPLFKKIIVSSTILTIIDVLQKLSSVNEELLNYLNLIKYGFGIILEIIFLLIYYFRPQYIKYALLFYNHLLIAQYARMEVYPVSQQLVYTVGIIIYQIVNALFGEFREAVYQTISFGSFYLIMAFRNDSNINFNLIALILAAVVILISAFYENIRALRSQFKLGNIDNQWELIFYSMVQDYMIFYYNENTCSFKLNQQCPIQDVRSTYELRKLLRQIKVTKKQTLEQCIFKKINDNEEQKNIINQEVQATLSNNELSKIRYSVFYGFNTIILLYIENYSTNKQNREEIIEKLYQSKYKQLLALMMKLVRKYSVKENSIKLIGQLRKYCIYIHLKDMIMNDGTCITYMTEINFKNIIKTLRFLFFQKSIKFQNLITRKIVSCKQYLLVILIEILEISLSNEIFVKFEQLSRETFTMKIFCIYNDKSCLQLKHRINSYLPYLLDVQFNLQCNKFPIYRYWHDFQVIRSKRGIQKLPIVLSNLKKTRFDAFSTLFIISDIQVLIYFQNLIYTCISFYL